MEKNEKTKEFELPEELQIVNYPYSRCNRTATNLAKLMTIAANWCKKSGTDFGTLLQACKGTREHLWMQYIAKCLKAGEDYEHIYSRFFEEGCKFDEERGIDSEGRIFDAVMDSMKQVGAINTVDYLWYMLDYVFIIAGIGFFKENPEERDEMLEIAKETFDM